MASEVAGGLTWSCLLLPSRKRVFLGLSSELALRTTCRHFLPPEIWKSTLVPTFSIFQR